ncbi:MAG: glycosyltransferase family 2 protein [Rickettsiales bacterium]|nr:MAG: glycosyltransferase family 2 protein [Rickettsiales bacterium]
MSNYSVTIFLCTCNGGLYLAEQLESFSKQSYKNWNLIINDDDSSDQTKDIIYRYQQESKNIIEFKSYPRRGFVKNFLSSVCETELDSDFFAFADQDDIWLENKLDRAVTQLQTMSNDRPSLYCSRTELINEEGEHIEYSPLFTKPPSFANALVQSIAGGNTMVFNKAAYELIKKAGSNIEVISHDWWIYQLVTSSGGDVFYDQHPEILYRQHTKNLIGSNNNLIARFSRIKLLLKGIFREWNDKNIAALKQVYHLLILDNKKTLDKFQEARQSRLLPRLKGLLEIRIYRQTTLGNLGLIFAAIFNLIISK